MTAKENSEKRINRLIGAVNRLDEQLDRYERDPTENNWKAIRKIHEEIGLKLVDYKAWNNSLI
jgi:hypothetical protein